MERKKLNGHISLFVANLIFGLNNPLSRSITPDFVDPYVLTFFRLAGGSVLFWLISLFLRKEKVAKKDILLLFLAGIFSLSLNQLPFIVGLSMTSPIDASIVVTLLPILSMIFAALIIKEPITLKKAFGVLVGASGALILIFGSAHTGNSGIGTFRGNLVVFIAVLSFALYLTLFKNLISRYSAFTVMKWMFVFATIQCAPFCIKPLVATDFTAFDTSVYLRIGYVVIFATFISYILLGLGQQVLRPTTLSMYNYVQPIVASIATIFIGLDNFGIDKIISAALVFAGVYFVTQSKSKEQIEKENTEKRQSNKAWSTDKE